MSKDLPRISVIIPSYNKADYIGATIKSIIDQKYPNLEVIIQDGGSKDGTVEIIKKFAKKYPIITWISKKDNGQVDAINTGLRKASGLIVTYINADDVYKKGALFEVGSYFLKHPKTLWLTGFGDIIDNKGKINHQLITEYKNILLRVNSLQILLMVNYITQAATFLSKRAYLKFGSFTGTRKYVMEYEMWLKLGSVKMPAVLKNELASFRLTKDNISATAFKELLSIDNNIAREFTNNSLILILHRLHNLLRIGIVSLSKVT